MPRKKKHRHTSNESKPVKIVNCEACGEAIEVPDHCQHGKKLANCQGTNCNRAHIKDHNNTCALQITRRESGTQAANQKSSREEHAILAELVKQELRNIEGIRGREFQYLRGVPRDEALRRLDSMGLEELRELAAMLKSLGDGKTTAEKAMYDDEDSSDDDTPRCLTPPDEE